MAKQKAPFPFEIGREYALQVGDSFLDGSKDAYHTFRYDMLPGSISTTSGTLKLEGTGQVRVEYQQAADNATSVFLGNRAATSKECIVVFDKERHSCTIERVVSQVTLKYQRPVNKNKADSIPSSMKQDRMTMKKKPVSKNAAKQAADGATSPGRASTPTNPQATSPTPAVARSTTPTQQTVQATHTSAAPVHVASVAQISRQSSSGSSSSSSSSSSGGSESGSSSSDEEEGAGSKPPLKRKAAPNDAVKRPTPLNSAPVLSPSELRAPTPPQQQASSSSQVTASSQLAPGHTSDFEMSDSGSESE